MYQKKWKPCFVPSFQISPLRALDSSPQKAHRKVWGFPATETTEMRGSPAISWSGIFCLMGFSVVGSKLQVFWRVFVEFISVSFSCFISSMERHFLGTEIQKSYYELTVSSSPFSHHPIPYRSTFSWFNSFVVITPSPSASIIFIISCVQGAKMLGGIQHKSFCITFFREGKQKMNKIRWAFVVLLRRSLKSSKICSAVYDFCFLQQLFFANFALKSFIPKIPKWLHFAKNTTFERVLKKHWIKGDWNVV